MTVFNITALLSPTTTFAGSARQIFRPQLVLTPTATFAASTPRQILQAQSVLAPAAALAPRERQTLQAQLALTLEAIFAVDISIGGVEHLASGLTAEAFFAADAALIKKVGTDRDRVDPFPDDPLNLGILEHGGSLVIFKSASGLEKAFADVDAQRLTATYAELPRDQWDPDRIVYRNLAYLAWAMGVNLWEDDWPEAFRRYWTKYQWTRKYERGSELGLRNFVHAISAGGKVISEVKRVTRPPAITYPLAQVGNLVDTLEALVPGALYSGEIDTHIDFDELEWRDVRPKPSWQDLINYERTQYVSRFAQLRGYPFVGRVQLPWLCFLGPHHRLNGTVIYQKNGRFLGPSWKLYPTIQDAGGKYTYTYTLWDRGVETTLTHRAIAHVTMGPSAGWGFTPGVSQYDDQVLLPLPKDIDYFTGEAKYLGAGGSYGIFLGPVPPLRTITVAHSGPLPLTQGKAQYRTVLPSEQLLDLIPEKVAVRHPVRKTEWYMGKGYYLRGGIPRSNAWQFLYDRWYLFDADRVPNYRRTNVYMGNCRFGIHKYTAEALIKVRVKQSRYYPVTTGYLRGYLKALDTSPIDKVRRAVCASMALRDTVLINTAYTRRLQLRDIIRPDGSHQVSQLVSN